MTFSIRPLFLIPSLVLCLAMPSCKRETEKTQSVPTQIVLLTANAKRPYEAAQVQIFQKLVASRSGLQFTTQDAAEDATQQARQLDQALAEKPLAVVFTPVKADSLAPAIARETEEGRTMLIGLGAASAKLSGVVSLQVDQRGLGRMAGELVVQALQRKAKAEGQSEAIGRVVELRGDEENDSDSGQRHEGFLEALGQQQGVILVHDAAGQWSRKGGHERTTEALRLQSRFDVIYAHNDAMALGASTALGENRQNVMIIGTDGYRGQEGGYSLVNRGDIDASIYQPILVDLALKIILRRSEEPDFITKPTYRVAPAVINPKTLDEIRLKGFPALPDL
jgi:ABC-type sugar transport system substrate-binding protein